MTQGKTMTAYDPDSILIEHGIRPSRQRRAILKFIAEHPMHPTAEDVYQALYKKIKTRHSRVLFHLSLSINGCACKVPRIPRKDQYHAPTKAP